MSAANWSDRYANAADLADQLQALPQRASIRMAIADLRAGTTDSPACSLAVAEMLDELAAKEAKAGCYPRFVVLTDAAEALRSFITDDDGITTGTFHALRSSCIAGVSVTEYEEE